MLGQTGRLKEAEELVGSIPGGPGLSVLQSLLGACKIHRNVEMGRWIANALMEMEPTESGDWENVAKVRKGMRVKVVKKEVGFSWVDGGDMDGLHGFSSSDKSHPQCGKIWRIVECLGLEMNFRVRKRRGKERESICNILSYEQKTFETLNVGKI
ncbi:hypothetical protein LWI28_022287 [Acer negundo]|uniref:Uncharacterized protein n=1 Tax=Acer negundo TaxID=4023 RepID=A0AAD5JHB6_ACENE|nr:hypothetical protein LWI28_022287 [Acer negundo]